MTMADKKYSFLYEHRGLLQAERPAQAPSGDAMRVMDRRFEDLVRRTANFAYGVIYYGDDNTEQGRWSDLFSLIDENKVPGQDISEIIGQMSGISSVPPHLALLFAFFKMLLVEQKDLNSLTDRQLEFYFREVLGFRMKPSAEGMVTVFAELARNSLSVGIPKGQLFDAGKDAAGEPVAYESVDELRLGREEVAFFATYGDKEGFKVPGPEVPVTAHALCVASRLFGVSGEKVSVFFGDDGDTPLRLSTLGVTYTTAEGWWPSEDQPALAYSAEDGLVISGDMPPMAPYDPQLHGEGLQTGYPVIRFVSPENLGILPQVLPEQVRKVRVVVENGAPLRLENKYGPVENLPGVNPFGFDGHKGDWFEVVLPFPATDLEVAPVEMNNNDVYAQDPQDEEAVLLDRVTYRITGNDCDQEWLSKNYSINLLQLMKEEKVDRSEIEQALSGSLMAVSPRLTSPVSIRSASYADPSPELFLTHPCGEQKMVGQERLNADFVITPADLRMDGPGDPDAERPTPSAVYLAFTDADLESGQMSLYFRMGNDSLDPAERVVWYYMSDDQWTRFGESSILKDTTCGFSQDGTVLLDYQDPMQRGGRGFKDGYTWIKGVCSNGNCQSILEVRNRAIELAFAPSSKGAGPGGVALPAGTISKTVGSIVGLKKVSQPFDGLVGTVAEAPDLFRRRVAETLRHKGRAWTAWDYETLVLGAFPEVAYVKCLPAYRDGRIEPGSMTVLVIPFAQEDAPVAGDRLINKVKEQLQKVSSPFALIDVVSPRFRTVRVSVEIVLRRGFNDTFRYQALANDALRDFLRPWKGYGEGRRFKEGGGVSDIIAFLESLPFVDFVKDIHVHQGDGTGEYTEVDMNGSMVIDDPIVFLTSDSNHLVTCKTAN